ncbi:tyrosine-type recombinase/integrase [Shewanella algae]
MASGVEVGKLKRAPLRRWLSGGVTRDYRDPQYPTVRLRANGERTKASIFLVFNEQNVTRWRKVGTWPDLCIDTFLEQLPATLAERAAGGEVMFGQFVTVADVVTWYAEHVADNTTMSVSWRRNVRSIVTRHLIPRAGQLPLASLSWSDLDSVLVKSMLADGYSPRYVVEVVSKLKTAFSSAAGLRLLDSNPLAGFKPSVRLPKALDARLYDSDLGELFKLLSETVMVQAMLFVLMMMFGTRINETRQARWDQFTGDVWVIPPSNTKNGNELRLPLTKSARALIDHYRRWQLANVGKRAWLFPGRGQAPIAVRTAQDWSVGLRFKYFTSHDIRRLFRTIIAEIGIDTVIGELLLNHSLPVLLRTYVQSSLNAGVSQALEQYHQYLIERGFNQIAPEIIPRSHSDLGNGQSQMASGWL